MTLVVDASITLDWCFASEQTSYANAVLDHVIAQGALVPSLWPAEVANGLVTARRRQRLTALEIPKVLAMLQALPIRVVAHDWRGNVESLVAIGDRYQLTAYDACYLVTALRAGCPIATHDEALIAAAQAAGIPQFAPPTG